ncbi:MAG: nucleoside hydrolase [Acidimicrobiales bacterium]
MTAAAEFNTGADPEAADVVFTSGVHLVMAGLDLTTQFEIGDDFGAEVRSIGSPGAALLADLTSFVLDRMEGLASAGEPTCMIRSPCSPLPIHTWSKRCHASASSNSPARTREA